MPGQAPVVGDERDALRVFLEYHQSSYLAVAFGLSDEQARSKPTVSALSIGGLIKHATGVQRSWMERVAAAPISRRRIPDRWRRSWPPTPTSM